MLENHERLPIPWERRNEEGFLKSLWETIRQVLFKPAGFFQNLEIKDSYREPFYFYLTIAVPVLIISIAYDMLFRKAISLPQALIALILVPLLIFIAAAIMHLPVLLFGGKGGFKGTFNVLAYCSAVRVFDIIPLIGSLIGFVWGFVVAVIGYKRIHKLSTPRAFFAYALIPALLLILAFFAIITIPNLLKGRLLANESLAQETVRTLSKAAETYAHEHNSTFPKDEYDLKLANPPYINEIYNNRTIGEYQYSVNFKPSGYEIIAKPSDCGFTGNRIFFVETGGKESEKSCR